MNNTYELQSKVIQDRIQQTEKNAKNIVESMASLCRKEAKTRDKFDDLARVFDQVATNEEYNDTSENALKSLSLALIYMADSKDIECARLEEKIINELTSYEVVCRNAKEEIKSLTSSRNEITKRRSSDLNKKLRHQGFIESDLMASNVQICKINKELQLIGETFEKQKVTDFKEILMNFILIQMKYFSSGLEILTGAYKDVQSIDASKDFEQFNKHVQQHEGIKASHSVTFGKALSILSQSASNLDRLGRRAKTAIKTRTTRKGQSSMSLDSLSSASSDIQEIRKESKVVQVQLTENEDETSSDDSEDTDLEDDSTETDDVTDTKENQFRKTSVNRIEHAN